MITEAMHLLSADRFGPRRLAELVGASGLEVFDLSSPLDLREVVGLMEKYADAPMDFADGTLVLLGEAPDLRDVLTLDVRGFSTYRTRNGRSFRFALDR